MIDDVLTSCLPVAAMAESTAASTAARLGAEAAAAAAVAAAGGGGDAGSVDGSGECSAVQVVLPHHAYHAHRRPWRHT